jgi:hypothetical protein
MICNELEEIRRGKYEQKEKGSFGEEGNRRAIRSSSEGVQPPYLHTIKDLSDLHNKAIP